MIPYSPILTEDGPRFYRSALRAASNLLLEARQWRNEIERLGPRQVDLSLAEGNLKAAVQSLEISLAPHFIGGKFFDPRDTPERLDLPGVEQVNIAQELAESRDGTFSAFGFTERSSHEVVYKLGKETLHAVSFLNQKIDQQALDFLFGPDSPLRTERRGLGEIPAAEASRVKAECVREAERAWSKAKPTETGWTGGKTARENKGLTVDLEVAIARGQDSLVLQASGLPPFPIPTNYSELFRPFAAKVACGSPQESVGLADLNHSVGVEESPRNSERASTPLRTAIKRLNDELSRWAPRNDQGPWIRSRKGQGYYLAESVDWHIGDPGLEKELRRYSQSVWGIDVPPTTLEENTPLRDQRLPAQPRRVSPPDQDE